MDFGLTEEQSMLQDMARDFAQNEIAPTVDEDEKKHVYNEKIVKKRSELSSGSTRSGTVARTSFTTFVSLSRRRILSRG